MKILIGMVDLHYIKNNKRDGLQESKPDTYQELPSSDKRRRWTFDR
ncbi:MAG: hypothetical protein KI791_12990 [Cyclobacteriaceae bacterium]|nr:hypothetical protein [Cyclobacteriaceae bacterium SS2]